MDQIPWLLLLYSLPAHRNTERVAVWRRLKKIGALQLTTSTYVLPDQPAQCEHFQWLTKLIRDSTGEATLVRVRAIDGLPTEKLIELFNSARANEYAAIGKRLRQIERRKKTQAETAEELHQVTRQFHEIRRIDFFNSSRGLDLEMQLRKAEEKRRSKGILLKIDP